MRRRILTAAIALSNGLSAGASTVDPSALVDFDCGAPTLLATEKQKAFEHRVPELLGDPAIRQAIAGVEALYRTDAVAQTASGAHTLGTAARSITAAMADWGLLMSEPPGVLYWTAKAAHRWGAITVPNSGYGIENPDNVYRHMRIDPAERYEIHGRLDANGPSQQSFIVYAGLPGTGTLTKEGAGLVGMLDRVQTATDGQSFVITLDSQPADGRPNHIQLNPAAQLLIVRDTLADWRQQRPNVLSVVTQSEEGGAIDAPNAVATTLALLETVPGYWLEYDNRYIYSRPANVVATPRVRGAGWGASISGHFQLNEAESLVITLNDTDAAYVGFQLADPWGVALDYVDRSGSLNANQVRRNDDGTITYVISASDPGHPNWLDTGGLDRGIFAIRWQAFARPVAAMDGAVQSVERLESERLSEAVPAYNIVDAVQRSAQRAQRRADFLVRLGCEQGQLK